MQRTGQISNGNIDLRWTGNIPKTATSKYRISFPMARMCFHTLFFFGRHIFCIINFRGKNSYVYFLIVCTTGVVKIIFRCRKWKILFKKRHSEIWFMRKYVFASLLNIISSRIIYILRSPTLLRNTYQHNLMVCCFKSPIVSFFWLFSN